MGINAAYARLLDLLRRRRCEKVNVRLGQFQYIIACDNTCLVCFFFQELLYVVSFIFEPP